MVASDWVSCAGTRQEGGGGAPPSTQPADEAGADESSPPCSTPGQVQLEECRTRQKPRSSPRPYSESRAREAPRKVSPVKGGGGGAGGQEVSATGRDGLYTWTASARHSPASGRKVLRTRLSINEGVMQGEGRGGGDPGGGGGQGVAGAGWT